ncbi:MAG TPA: hypothetical protein VFT68_08090 [Lapillicoccus sp.]|nr:hypothetical protein [Lapillicoccus sp.]
MTRYAGRHRAPSAVPPPAVPRDIPTVQLGASTAVGSPGRGEETGSSTSRVARTVGVAAAVAVLTVGVVDAVTSTSQRGLPPVSAADLPQLPPEAAVQAVAFRGDTADLSAHRAEVRGFRAEADAAAARAAAQAAADAAAKAAADAAAQAAADAARAAADAAAADAQRQAAAAQAARDSQRQSLIDNARKDPRGAARAMLGDFGFADSQFSCLNSLWTRESNWLYTATNPSSGAYGIPQSLPASKMASAGADYRTNPVTQIKWGLGYIQDRYGTPCGAWAHSQATGWY